MSEWDLIKSTRYKNPVNPDGLIEYKTDIDETLKLMMEKIKNLEKKNKDK